MTTEQPEAKRFKIEEVPLVNLFLATDKHRRIRFSADIIELYHLRDDRNGVTPRVSFGYDHVAKAIAIKLAASSTDPTAANIDKRGYTSAAHFYRKTQLAEVSRRFVFAAEQDGWLIFIAAEE
jgi:hypothetical protein